MPWGSVFTWHVLRNTPLAKFLELVTSAPLFHMTCFCGMWATIVLRKNECVYVCVCVVRCEMFNKLHAA